MALLSRAGLFRFCLSEIPMPVLDIVTHARDYAARGAPSLSDEVAVIARDCHFDHGVISPLEDDSSTLGMELPHRTYHPFFAMASTGLPGTRWWRPFAPRLPKTSMAGFYYTDGEYPKVTHAQIATGGSNRPTAWYRLGIPAPGVPVGLAPSPTCWWCG